MRYLITGGSGYIGSRLTEILAARDDVEEIVALDVRPPASPQAKTTFVRGDVRDAGALAQDPRSATADNHGIAALCRFLDDELRDLDEIVGRHQSSLWSRSVSVPSCCTS